ncbi:MAG: HEAT repeat domain-containing protein [Tardiphaga sp.]
MPLIRGTSPAPTGAAPNVEGIAKAISSGTVDERWAAARAAAELPTGVAILDRALATETAPRVREAIFTSLAKIRTPASAAVAAPYVRSDDPEIRTAALDALRAMPEATAPHLPGLIHDADTDVRLLACELVRNQPAEAANQLLTSLLSSEQEANVCAAAIEVLAEIGETSALPVLAQCAARFPDDPFLGFAIGMARDRIGSQVLSRD